MDDGGGGDHRVNDPNNINMGMSATFACVVDRAKGFPKYKDSIQIDEQIKVRSLWGGGG